MEKKALIMVRVMMNRYHKGSTDTLFSSLSEEEGRNILEQDVQSDDVVAALEKPEKVMDHIHYSWLVAPLQKISAPLQPYFFAALPKEHQTGLQKLFSQEWKVSLSPPVQSYLLSVLCKEMRIHEVIPAPYLPAAPLVELTHCDKGQLVHLIDLLGVYDLANEVRQIINKQHLTYLYTCLSKGRLRYLRTVMYLQDKLAQEKLGIEQFRGTRQTLEKVLHRRGIIRLAKALSGCKSDLLWHITHILDIGRANMLEKHWSKEEIPIITPSLVQQALHALHFLEKEGKNIE